MSDFSLHDTTTTVAKNAEFFESTYNSIRSVDNATKTARDLSGDEQYMTSASKSVSVEDVRLSCEWNDSIFAPVTEVKNGKTITYYGGDQAWFNDDRSTTGCGPVAAANIMYYLSLSSSKYENLYPYSSASKALFTIFMGTMYKQINPSSWFGEASYSSFADDTVKWAKGRNVNLTVHKAMITFDGKIPITNGIKDGLRKDKPVAIVNLNKWYHDETANADVGWHWVTVTKYYQSSSDKRWIAVSTWGKRLSLNWDAYYQSMADPLPSLGGGYVWFE